jgi:hypothetical protein
MMCRYYYKVGDGETFSEVLSFMSLKAAGDCCKDLRQVSTSCKSEICKQRHSGAGYDRVLCSVCRSELPAAPAAHCW